MKCENCDMKIEENDDSYEYETGQYVCDTCYHEAEPTATVIYSDNTGAYPHDDGSMDYITEYDNDTPFKLKYVSTDGWRGYYDVETAEGYTNIHSDCILAYSEDERQLKNFDENLEEYCEQLNIPLVKVFCRTSNVFSSGYDVFIPDNRVNELNGYVEELKERYRNEQRFIETALTGKNPDQITSQDKDFVMCAGLIKAGSTPEEAVKTVKTIRKLDEITQEE